MSVRETLDSDARLPGTVIVSQLPRGRSWKMAGFRLDGEYERGRKPCKKSARALYLKKKKNRDHRFFYFIDRGGSSYCRGREISSSLSARG